MRLLKVAIGVLAVMIGFAIFAWTSAPHGDDLPQLRKYVISESAYFTERDDSFHMRPSGRFVYRRSYRFRDYVTDSEIVPIFRALESPTREFLPTATNSFVAGPTGRSGMVCPGLYEYRVLNWHEVLWARLIHLGKDPFPKESFP